MEPWRGEQERGLSGRQQVQPFPSCWYRGPSSQDYNCGHWHLSCLPQRKPAGSSHPWLEPGQLALAHGFQPLLAQSLHSKDRLRQSRASCSGSGACGTGDAPPSGSIEGENRVFPASLSHESHGFLHRITQLFPVGPGLGQTVASSVLEGEYLKPRP